MFLHAKRVVRRENGLTNERCVGAKLARMVEKSDASTVVIAASRGDALDVDCGSIVTTGVMTYRKKMGKKMERKLDAARMT
jgi:hypothetical protein